MKYKKLVPILIVMAFYGCIGTDIVEEVIVPRVVSISRTTDSIQVGGTFTFQADYFNQFGQRESVPFNWSSSDPSVVTVDGNGVASALAEGNAYIRASFSEVIDSVKVGVGAMVTMEAAERMGVFMGNRDYRVNGSFTMTESGSDLVLSFANDFTSSNGPGLYVYLSNAQTSVSGGVEVGKLQRNSGAQSYTIPMSQAQLNSYRHVLIYCKPFGVAFGIGTFLN